MIGRVRVISGIWRSRWVEFEEQDGLRPTPNRLRETLFNWLQPYIPGSYVLDLFAGSGVLGFEALSRGAANVVAVEKNPVVVKRIQQQSVQLNAKDFEIFQENALLWIRRFQPQKPFDGVFVDPPFELNLWGDVLEALHRPGLLAEHSWVYVERPRKVELDFWALGFSVLKDTTAGDVHISLLTLQKDSVCEEKSSLGS